MVDARDFLSSVGMPNADDAPEHVAISAYQRGATVIADAARKKLGGVWCI